MKKIIISKLFLYKHRFTIGYVLLGLAFIGLLFLVPLIAQKNLSSSEMESAVSSYNLEPDAVFNGDLVDLPYRLLQKVSILAFGLTPFAIKLPNIIIGILLGFLLILILNRWFKNNVSLLASILMTLSTIFLSLIGTGTPLIMLVFWPVLLLWLGSKIQGEKRPEPIFCFAFALSLLLSIFTPYMIYFAIFCVIFVLSQPHLRFVIKRLPKIPFVITILIAIAGIALLITNIIQAPSVMMELFFAKNFATGEFFNNILTGIKPIFSWSTSPDGPILSPLVSLPVFALALIGLFSTTKGFFASRNSIATLLLVFTVVITGFNPSSIVFIIIPLSILVAHGLKYVLEKWYGLFPENPYARISALIPLSILFAIIILPNILHNMYSYRFNPNIAPYYTNNLSIIREKLTNETIVAEPESVEYDFYKILEGSTDLKVTDAPTSDRALAFLKKPEKTPEGYHLSRIITSEKSDNSDIIYLYTVEGE